MLQNFGLVYVMVQRFSQKFPVSFSAVSVTMRIGARGKDCRTGYYSHIWFLWDVKEPGPLFEKSRGRRPRWCGQPLLGRVGYL